MKFSDMMGKGGKAALDETETTDATSPPAQRTAPPLPEAPIRFGTKPSDVDTAPAAAPVAPMPPTDLADTTAVPSMMEVMSELTPRVGGPTTAVGAASAAELDASAWLEGLATIDDDLLPR